MPDPYREPIEEKTPAELPAASPISSIEQEILELEKQLLAKRAALKEKPLEQVLKPEQPLSSAPPAVPVAPPTVVTLSPVTVKEETQKFKGLEKNQQLKGLVDLAFQKGVIYATEVARNLDNPYLLDEFHDTLIDELRQELIKTGKLEEI
jgi:hypothetical protein